MGELNPHPHSLSPIVGTCPESAWQAGSICLRWSHRGCTCEAQKAAGGERFQDGVLVEIDFEPCLSAVQNNLKNPPWRQNVCALFGASIAITDEGSEVLCKAVFELGNPKLQPACAPM